MKFWHNLSVPLAICLSYGSSFFQLKSMSLLLLLVLLQTRNSQTRKLYDKVRNTRYTISTSARISRDKTLPTARISTDTPNSIVASTREMEAKITKIFIVILIAMLCCYGPSTVLIYIINHAAVLPFIGFEICSSFSSSCIRP